MNIGVIGIGSWGNRVIKEYVDLLNEGIIDNVSICEINKELLKEYKNFKSSNNYKKFLEDDSIDAVHICTPNNTHYDIVKESMENDVHVLVEKPMTTKSSDAYKLIELSAENGLILQVGHIYRFANVMKKLKELMNENYFGEIKYLTFKWTNLFQPAQDTDIIWDLTPHIIDMTHFLTSMWPIDSTVFRKNKKSAFLNLDYKDFISNVELSWITHERKRELNIIGSDRSAKVQCVKQHIHIYENKKEFDIDVVLNNTIKDEAINFITSIKNKKMPYNSHIIGARSVDVIENILEDVN